MNTTAYITSNAPRKAELDEQIAALDAQLKAAEQQVKGLRASTAEAKTLKKQIATLTQQRQALNARMPALLFSEAAALNDLEQDMRDAIENWEEQRREWLDEARYDPTSAIQHGAEIIAQQTRVAQVVRLQRAWTAIAQAEGRTLTAFRKAYDQVAAQRRQELVEKITGSSTSHLYNAVSHEQARVLATQHENTDLILGRLAWYEAAAARMPLFDA